MKTPVSSLTNSLVNTDRVSIASKQPAQKIESLSGKESSSSQFSSFRREVPMPRNAEFVEVDGKKYFLNAPRGSYVDIIV